VQAIGRSWQLNREIIYFIAAFSDELFRDDRIDRRLIASHVSAGFARLMIDPNESFEPCRR